MAINTRSVIKAGVAAAVVMAVFDGVNGFVLAGQREAMLHVFNSEFAATLEGLYDMEVAPPRGFMGFWVVSRLTFGILLAWTYASMRPCYGAGPKTAALAALPFWGLLTLIGGAFVLIGMSTWGYFALGTVVTAIEFAIEANVAGYVYAEA